MSLTHSPLVSGPGSDQGGSQEGGGWTGAESGSRQGSWSVRPAAGAGGEGARGREGASGVPLVEADRGNNPAHVPHSGGSCVLRH